MLGSTAWNVARSPRGTSRRLRAVLQGVGFWTAVILPFLYVPSLALGGVLPIPPSLVGAAVALNLIALLVGHRHEPAARGA